MKILAKIAVESNLPKSRQLAARDGWIVNEVICEAGPHDRPFEELHANASIGIILGGTFQYRSSHHRSGRNGDLMVPGALLLGNPGEWFICSHEHGTGDRCVAFSYEPEWFERVAYEAGGRGAGFGAASLPPVRDVAPVVAKAAAVVAGTSHVSYEELGIEAAARAIQISRGIGPRVSGAEASAMARVTRVIRAIENEVGMQHDLRSLAQIARLSPYHFLRTFEGLTGTTPHQYVRRLRLRQAAMRLKTGRTKVLEIALDCGFGDVSNFNRAFRGEFRLSPREFRARG